MPNHYQPYPTVDDRQRREFGTVPEPTSTAQLYISNTAAGTVSPSGVSMLTLKGTDNDASGIRETNHGQGNVLLHKGSEWRGVLFARSGFQGPFIHEGRAVCEVHADRDSCLREESSSDGRSGDSSLEDDCYGGMVLISYLACALFAVAACGLVWVIRLAWTR